MPPRLARHESLSHVSVTALRRCAGGPLLVAGLLTAAALAGCGSSTPKLNTAPIEKTIAHSILLQRNIRATVHCPANVPRKTGTAFTCNAKLDAGSYPISVTETNSSGHVRYGNPAPLVILNSAKVEHAIERSILAQRHLKATVGCPAQVIQQAGVSFTCTATVGGKRYRFAVTETNSSGHVRYLGLR